MRTFKLLMLLLVVAALTAGPALAGGHGCSKARARQAAEQAQAGPDPCCGKAHQAREDGEPCCLNGATKAALAALKQASETSGSPEAASAVEAAVLAVEKAGGTIGCPKSKAAAQKAAVAALQEAAEKTGSAEAAQAVEAVLVAANREAAAEQAEAH